MVYFLSLFLFPLRLNHRRKQAQFSLSMFLFSIFVLFFFFAGQANRNETQLIIQVLMSNTNTSRWHSAPKIIYKLTKKSAFLFFFGYFSFLKCVENYPNDIQRALCRRIVLTHERDEIETVFVFFFWCREEPYAHS